jgi:hypothetical protein
MALMPPTRDDHLTRGHHAHSGFACFEFLIVSY